MIIFIAGPTGIGKSKYAVLLAKEIGGEVVSADSVQIYKGLDIGSAKITDTEKLGITHHMIDICNPDEEFSAYLYQKKASEIIKDIKERSKIPIVVGGTGLYIDSLLFPLDNRGAFKDQDYRDYLENIAKTKGNKFLHSMLVQKNYKEAEKIHFNNTRKIIRKLEIERFKEKDQVVSRVENTHILPKLEGVHFFVLERDRNNLYEIINKRVDKMIEQGLIEEVKKLKSQGINKNHLSMGSIGYNQILSYLDGESDLENIISIIKKKSRNYAKRQYTWFRKYQFAKWINIENKKDYEVVGEILSKII